jgi:hypothetical protein
LLSDRSVVRLIGFSPKRRLFADNRHYVTA